MATESLKTVTLGIASVDDVKQRLAAAFSGAREGEHVSFETVSLLWKVLTAKRWELLQQMAGQGEMSMREAARRVNRDVKAVHGDIRALLGAGIIELRPSGKVVFPYDAVRVDFTLRAA